MIKTLQFEPQVVKLKPTVRPEFSQNESKLRPLIIPAEDWQINVLHTIEEGNQTPERFSPFSTS